MAERQYAVNRSPAGEALTVLVLQVVRLATLFTARGEALARPAGQTLARWVVLDAVASTPATVAQVSRRLGYARQSVQRVADLLVADALATYEDNPQHRRARLLRPTPRGRDVLQVIDAGQKTWSDALGATIGESDLRRASAILDRLLLEMREP